MPTSRTVYRSIVGIMNNAQLKNVCIYSCKVSTISHCVSIAGIYRGYNKMS